METPTSESTFGCCSRCMSAISLQNPSSALRSRGSVRSCLTATGSAPTPPSAPTLALLPPPLLPPPPLPPPLPPRLLSPTLPPKPLLPPLPGACQDARKTSAKPPVPMSSCNLSSVNGMTRTPSSAARSICALCASEGRRAAPGGAERVGDFPQMEGPSSAAAILAPLRAWPAATATVRAAPAAPGEGGVVDTRAPASRGAFVGSRLGMPAHELVLRVQCARSSKKEAYRAGAKSST